MSKKKIPVVISPGYGCGWSTWNSEVDPMEPTIAKAIEDKVPISQLKSIASSIYPNETLYGLETAIVKYVYSGDSFDIKDNDGYETLIIYPSKGYIA